MRLNVPAVSGRATHEGGPAGHQKPIEALLRAVSTCLLWEHAFYETGSDIATNIEALCALVSAEDLAAVAVEARQRMNLRHVPLFLVRQLAKLHRGPIVGDALAAVLRRPDEATEFLALWWKDGRGDTAKLSAQVKRGLRLAFAQWDEYRLAKYAGDGDKIKLRDALFLCHAKPKDEEQAALWKRLVAGELAAPDTWEVALSSGADKRETWERLLRERKLGYQALLMNLRNLIAAGVDGALVREALLDGRGRERMFPYRFLAAARYAPQYADVLSEAMIASLSGHEKLTGETVLVVDVSGSMDDRLSAKGEMLRVDAAGCLAVVLREVGDALRVFTFSQAVVEVPNHRGLALAAAISASQPHSGTYLSAALRGIEKLAPQAHRVIVVTDEQSHDGVAPAWAPRSYLINVGPYKPGLDTSQGWKRISGWSDRVVDWMLMEETCARPEELAPCVDG
jgi:hypothetical protein